MDKLLEEKEVENWQEMGRLIHKMKPSLEMVGLTPLKEKIIAAEANLKSETNIPDTLPIVDEIIENCKQAIEELKDHL